MGTDDQIYELRIQVEEEVMRRRAYPPSHLAERIICLRDGRFPLPNHTPVFSFAIFPFKSPPCFTGPSRVLEPNAVVMGSTLQLDRRAPPPLASRSPPTLAKTPARGFCFWLRRHSLAKGTLKEEARHAGGSRGF